MVWNVHLHGGMSNNTRVLCPHCCRVLMPNLLKEHLKTTFGERSLIFFSLAGKNWFQQWHFHPGGTAFCNRQWSYRKQLSSDNFFNSLSPLHFLPPPFFPLLLLLLILLLLMGVSLLLLWADLDLFLLISSFTGLPPANHRLKLIIQVHIPNCPKIWNNEFDLEGSLLHLIKRERVQNSFDYHHRNTSHYTSKTFLLPNYLCESMQTIHANDLCGLHI